MDSKSFPFQKGRDTCFIFLLVYCDAMAQERNIYKITYMYFLIKKGIRSKNVLLLKVSWGKNYPDPKLPWCIFHVRFRYWAGASLVAQMVKNLPALWETHIWSLGQEDLLEKGMATHSSILAWRIPWTEEPGGLQSSKSQRVKEDWVTNTFTFLGTEYNPGCSWGQVSPWCLTPGCS